MVTVYSKPVCFPCKATVRDLTKLEIVHVVLPLLEVSDDQLEAWRNQGLLEAPIVITPDETWSGYRPDRIKQLTR